MPASRQKYSQNSEKNPTLFKYLLLSDVSVHQKLTIVHVALHLLSSLTHAHCFTLQDFLKPFLKLKISQHKEALFFVGFFFLKK